jgi:preprotein translocase subunit SecD
MFNAKWRFYFVIILILGSLWVTSPIYISQAKAPYWLTKLMPPKDLKLGLDLQGGTHLVLGVDVEKVVVEQADRNAIKLDAVFKEKNIPFDSVKRVGDTSRVSVKLKNVSDEDKVREAVIKYTGMIFSASGNGEIVFDLNNEEKSYIRKNAVSQTIEAIRNRIDEFGVNETSIQAQGSDRIVVQLPGVKDVTRAKSIIGRTARLEFKIVVNDPNFGKDRIYSAVNQANEAGVVYDEKTSYADYVDKLNVWLEGKIPSDTMVLFEKKVDPSTGKKFMEPYLLQKASPVTGDDLKDAYVGYNNEFGEPYVSFQMNTNGARYMEKTTGENIGKQLAIVLDKNIYSAPVIQAKISDQGQITLGSGRPISELQQEAEDIALVLRAGALPAQLTFEEERVVGPSLGNDSIEQGKLSFILGALIVVLFMLIYYRFSGAVADVAVVLNVVILMALMMLFGATLTLPGIAGIVLTVGMSVDANVIINERIREEIRSGNTGKAALEIGYDKALWTVLDANITTAIAGIVLLQYGTGPVKGFAVTLLIGIATSVFTGVYITRWIFEYLIEKGYLRKLSI